MEIHKIISDIMSSRNLTVADIARITGLPDSTVRGIITRKQKTVALDVAFKLSDGLGVSLEFLNGMTADPKNTAAPAKELEPPLTEEERTLIREFRNLKEADSRDRVWETIYGRQQIEVVHERERQQLALMAEQQNYGTSDDSAHRKSSSK